MQTQPTSNRLIRRPRKSPLEVLDLFLRGELAATATYEKALRHVGSPRLCTAFEQNRLSHADRCVVLAQLLRERGAQPSQRAGTWGVVSAALEGGAAVFGEEALLKALHEGESYGLEAYLRRVGLLDDELEQQLYEHVIPAQRETEARLRDTLKREEHQQ